MGKHTKELVKQLKIRALITGSVPDYRLVMEFENKNAWVKSLIYGITGTWIVVVGLALFAMCSCAHASLHDQTVRTSSERDQSTVRIEVSCLKGSPFDGDREINVTFSSGSGVIIDPSHVLTAYHVIKCDSMPIVDVRLSDGRKYRVYVDKESSTFDIARLRSFQDFGMFAPPIVWAVPKVGDPLCTSVASPKRAQNCGQVEAIADIFTYMRLPTPNGEIGFGDVRVSNLIISGNSGGPVYDHDGRLVGLVTEGAVPPGVGGRIRSLLPHPEFFQF